MTVSTRSGSAPPEPVSVPPPAGDRVRGRRLRRTLRASTGDGIAFSVMVGAGETYVPAFALALGVGELAAGWIVALPLVAGALIQLVSPRAVERLGSHRRWVLLCALTQALTLLAYAAAALLGVMPVWLLFVVATVYWASNLATGPAWNAWMGELVPRAIRPRFFAVRSRLAQVGVLAGLVGAGLALQWGRAHGVLIGTFAALFAVAAVSRLVSAAFLALKCEPLPLAPDRRRVHPLEWLSRVRHGDDGRLLAYMLAVQVALQVSGPFFTPYMLEQLRFSYAEYLLVISISFVTKMLVLPILGRLAHRAGSHRLLYASGVAIVPLSALWIVSDDLVWLCGVQVLSGAIWGAYELSTFLLLFEHVPQRERVSVLTSFNLANAIALVCGALLGGLVLSGLGLSRTAYLTVFGLSGVLRLGTLVLLARLRRVSFAPAELHVRPIAVRPNGVSLDAPIVSEMPEEAPEQDAG